MSGSDDFPSERVTGIWTEMSGRFGEFSDVFMFTDVYNHMRCFPVHIPEDNI